MSILNSSIFGKVAKEYMPFDNRYGKTVFARNGKVLFQALEGVVNILIYKYDN
jgi:hypothetical protein